MWVGEQTFDISVFKEKIGVLTCSKFVSYTIFDSQHKWGGGEDGAYVIKEEGEEEDATIYYD